MGAAAVVRTSKHTIGPIWSSRSGRDTFIAQEDRQTLSDLGKERYGQFAFLQRDTPRSPKACLEGSAGERDRCLARGQGMLGGGGTREGLLSAANASYPSPPDPLTPPG